MGKYTIYNDDIIDKEIDNRLAIIVSTIVGSLGNNVYSIILAGGYGRGEGSVIKENGSVRLLKDFDICVVTHNDVNYIATKNLLDIIYNKLRLDNAENSLFRHSKFAIDLKFINKNNINYPDIWFYDLKNSLVLYGEDITRHITYNSNDIPLSSGMRLLFEKVTGLLGHFNYYMLYKGVNGDQRTNLIYECMKTYIEIGTALCILYRRYVPSYRERVKIIKSLVEDKHLDDLIIHLPDLLYKIEYSTQFKFMPDFNAIDNPISLWFKTKHDLIKVILFYLKNYLDFGQDDLSILDIMSKKLSKIYYKPMLNAFKINKKINIPVSILNILYQLYTNIKYIKNIKKEEGELCMKPLINNMFISPALKFYPAGIYILLSLEKDGSVNNSFMEKARRILSDLLPIDRTETWEDMRVLYLKTYKYYVDPTLLK